MKTIISIALLYSFTTLASTEAEIMISNLWVNIGHQSKPKIIETKPKPVVEKPVKEKEKPITKKPVEKKQAQKKVVKKKTLSPGQMKIEEMKRKNRERLKNREEESKKEAVSKKESQSNSIYDMANRGRAEMYKKNRDTLTSWKNQEKETLQRWNEERKKFLSRIKQYKENTFELESSSGSYGSAKWNSNLSTVPTSQYHIVDGALDLPIRDQGRRPTCSAFAGTRAIEIALAQKGKIRNLSEQYVYWASKPYCQQSPCSKKGSWISYAYDGSKKSRSADIPLESSCPYNSTSVAGNETQIPISSSCRQGVVKVSSYKKLNSSNELIRALDNNMPVVAGFKLSPNFYKTKGIISYKDSLINGRMDSHANGHAVLIIGHMKVPKIYESEGKDCFIIANSWSQGWATGGYGCITQEWLKRYRVRNPFLAINQIKE